MKHFHPLGLLFLAVFAGWMEQSAAQETVEAVLDQDSFAGRLTAAALERTTHKVTYDPAYVTLDYPGGDVPDDKGVCTDVVIRSYRKLGLDLQKLVHEDMVAHFSQYPKIWGMKRTDRNIDHRRVPNLQKFFARHDAELKVTKDRADYLPGDLVAWDLNGKSLWHIGIVVEKPGVAGSRWIVHNIGNGPQVQDCLFDWTIIGHYRYAPPEASVKEGSGG
jgi:uncharacterized protein YijF (DUF1287 family)